MNNSRKIYRKQNIGRKERPNGTFRVICPWKQVLCLLKSFYMTDNYKTWFDFMTLYFLAPSTICRNSLWQNLYFRCLKKKYVPKLFFKFSKFTALLSNASMSFCLTSPENLECMWAFIYFNDIDTHKVRPWPAPA